MSAAYVRDDGLPSIDPVARRRAWARRLIMRGKDAPAYGTTEWLLLEDGPEKVAATVRAAECWATDGDESTARLEAQVDELRAAYAAGYKAGEDAGFHRRGVEHAETWRGGRAKPDPSIEADIEREWREWVNPPCQDAPTRRES